MAKTYNVTHKHPAIIGHVNIMPIQADGFEVFLHGALFYKNKVMSQYETEPKKETVAFVTDVISIFEEQ